MKSYLAVFIGGALGSLCRYAINMSAGSAWFPWPTFIENASGSLLLGLLTGFFSSRAKKPLIQLCLGTGFCGGYTTMSAFSKETALILQSAALHNGVLYLAASLASGICLAFIGIVLGNRIGGQAGQKKGALYLMMTAGFMIAGGIGSVLRFWLGNIIGSKFKNACIPASILIINILGSFMLGIFVSLDIQQQMLSTVIGTGFFGGFTTFSTFSVEAVQLLAEKRLKAGAAYIILTMACCVGGFWAGSLV